MLAGVDEPVPVAQRAEAQAVQAERQARSAKVQILIRDGRHTDDTLEEVWQNLLTKRLTGMALLATHLVDTGQLREGVVQAEVRDVLWTWITEALTAARCP